MAVILQKLIENERESKNIPVEWQYRDLESFGLGWKLFPYQKNAVNNTIALLFSLFDKWKEGMITLEENRQKLFELYRRNGLTPELEEELAITEGEQENYEFLKEFYQHNGEIPFTSLINRAAYWMATGSGKTLVMIKLIAVLGDLINKGLIPKKDVLILAPKDEILNQIKEHIDKFNKGSEISINLRSVKEYERAKNQQSIFTKDEITVFYYRADNIAGKDMVAKKKDGQRLDYESIYNNGNWYLILDEAHKGEKETSKRQQYYLALTHNGFLFNFSATFTDELDKATTISDYKLDTFLKDGYGKKLYVADSNFQGFAHGGDENEQKSIIAQSLIMLAVAKQCYKKIQDISKKLYHSPLLITLANSVNTDEADLKLFYELLSEIARGKGFNFSGAKRSLVEKLEINNKYLFDLGEFDQRLIPEINALTEDQFRKAVFNSARTSNIQVIKLRDNTRELAFKLLNADKYFMLIHASDIVQWESNVLEGYEFSTEVEESFFEDIENRPHINILLGSRIFSEGWDTNRPNIINFINIGISAEAQKYVLQSIGRGVRIEPMPNKRQRFNRLDLQEFSGEEQDQIKKHNEVLESLFVFATNQEVVRGMLKELEKQSSPEWSVIQGIIKNSKIDETKLPLFIPAFEREALNEKPFWIGLSELNELQNFANQVGPKILLLKNTINNIRTYKKVIDKNNFKNDDRRRRRTSENILLIADNYFNEPIKKMSEIKILEGEISHYKEIKTNLDQDEVKKIENDIVSLLAPKETRSELLRLAKSGSISDEEYERRRETIEKAENPHTLSQYLEFKVLEEHYYSPILWKKDSEKFQHIIKEDSEIEFLEKLLKYVHSPKNKLADCEWWYFSKIDQSIDKIRIPYFDNEQGEYRDFFPDFIFWLKKDGKFYLKFVDPHGTIFMGNSADKIDGFNEFSFDLSKLKNKHISGAEMYFYNDNNTPNGVDKFYKQYFTNDFNKIFSIK